MDRKAWAPCYFGCNTFRYQTISELLSGVILLQCRLRPFDEYAEILLSLNWLIPANSLNKRPAIPKDCQPFSIIRRLWGLHQNALG